MTLYLVGFCSWHGQVTPAELHLASTELVVADYLQPELCDEDDGLSDEGCSDQLNFQTF